MSSSLNAARRERELGTVSTDGLVDVLVIGGGVTGTGVALDAAARGLSVVLAEKHDLAFGTSRWSSKLVHGGLRYLASNPDAILVTHGHFDHLLDVPTIMAKTRARLIASGSSVDLARRAGAASGDAVRPGYVRQIGPWKIRVLPATHDRLFGQVPFDRPAPQAGVPRRAADWICGEPLAFLIEVNGQRIYIDSGGTPAQLPPNECVDLAILGMALPDSRARLAGALERLQPRYILPSHQDDFFRPLSAGFQFGPLTDFARVQRECAQQNRGRLILLNYFRPWMLPKAANPKFQKPNLKTS